MIDVEFIFLNLYHLSLVIPFRIWTDTKSFSCATYFSHFSFVMKITALVFLFTYFKFVKKNSMPNSVESLGYTSAVAWVYQDLLKALAILSNTAVRRSAIWKTKNHTGNQNKDTFLRFPFLTTEKTVTELQLLAVHLSLIFLDTRTTNEIFQQPTKQDSFRTILKSSAIMYEVSAW